MNIRIETPTVKTILLTTLYCAVAGGLCQLMGEIPAPKDIVFFAPPILFSIAVIIALRNTGRITVIRVLVMPVVLFAVFVGGIYLEWPAERLHNGTAQWICGLWNWVGWSLPGMATILVIGLLLKMRVRLLNVLIAGFCAALSCRISHSIAISTHQHSIFIFLDDGPIYPLWQMLVGFSVALLTARRSAPVGAAAAPLLQSI